MPLLPAPFSRCDRPVATPKGSRPYEGFRRPISVKGRSRSARRSPRHHRPRCQGSGPSARAGSGIKGARRSAGGDTASTIDCPEERRRVRAFPKGKRSPFSTKQPRHAQRKADVPFRFHQYRRKGSQQRAICPRNRGKLRPCQNMAVTN